MFKVLLPEPEARPVVLGPCSVAAAEPGHLAAMTTIYRAHLEHGFGTHEDPVPDAAEIGRRLTQARTAGLPALVALDAAGVVRGFTWARPWRERAGYAQTVEDSIYVARSARLQGVGRLLLGRLIGACEALGQRRMIATVGDARNHASIALHEAMGFTVAGFFEGAGWRDGRSLDVVMLQRALAAGSAVGHA